MFTPTEIFDLLPVTWVVCSEREIIAIFNVTPSASFLVEEALESVRYQKAVLKRGTMSK